MQNALLARAARAIEASRILRDQHRRVTEQHGRNVDAARLAVMKSAMARSEIKAYRDNRQDEPDQDEPD
ncbi:hypothetical protein [Bradyrhizobium sp. CB2312]|uniref:hypothetical protein n=1 Tax=Bradyrhizobium sp. CB2312 TaxID=3039155 RepID=UPI0024B23D81|nr:hypothetical protein [Bradyrhizobium sp. CB2312]WFU76361.1 hypothetical protein QA642_21330 [Bradyrhizobium sp. CB2312]